MLCHVVSAYPTILRISDVVCHVVSALFVDRDLKMENIMLDEKKKNIKIIGK